MRMTLKDSEIGTCISALDFTQECIWDNMGSWSEDTDVHSTPLSALIKEIMSWNYYRGYGRIETIETCNLAFFECKLRGNYEVYPLY